MSVRRLAKEQPASFAFSKDTLKKAEWWIAKYPADRRQSAVIPILWLVQKQEGWVSEPALNAIAELLGMPVIRVFEVATFYTMFQLEPVGKVALVQLCGTTPCMLRGANDLKTVLEAKIGPKNHLSADGKFSWEEVECLGGDQRLLLRGPDAGEPGPDSRRLRRRQGPPAGLVRGPQVLRAQGRGPHPDRSQAL